MHLCHGVAHFPSSLAACAARARDYPTQAIVPTRRFLPRRPGKSDHRDQQPKERAGSVPGDGNDGIPKKEQCWGWV